jgi:hypothetical protein
MAELEDAIVLVAALAPMAERWKWGKQEHAVHVVLEALRACKAALTEIDGEGPPKEPRKTWTSTDPDEAFEEGAVRGRWEAAVIARRTLEGATP